MVGSYGRHMFNFLSKCQTVFQSDCSISHSHRPGVRITVLYSHQHLVLSVFIILTILTGMKWYLVVVSISLPWWQMMLNIFHVVVWRSKISFGEVSVQIFAYIFWVVCFLIVEFGEFFIYSWYKSFIRHLLCRYFLLIGLTFHSLNSVLSKSWLFHLDKA